MVQSVSYLFIKPLEAYRGDGHGETSLVSSFSSALEEAATTSEGDAVSQTKDAESGTETDNTDADAQVAFKDPKTGQAVIYVESTEADDTSVSSSKTSSNVNTTSAASMKKTKYDSYFKAAAAKYDVSESLLKAIAKAESNFNANDISSAGAMGVMQLMPETAKSLGVTNPYDAEQNIMGGAKCIKQKLKEFKGNVQLALAAYNAGSGAVKRNGGVPSYCKSYVSKVLSYKEAFETASAVG